MRGGKGQPWQGGTCVPFFMRWPSVVKDGHDDPTLASGMDLLPTLAEIAGIPIKDTGVQGVSLLPNILQEPTGVPDDRLLFSHKGRWHSSEFLQDYQYVYASVCSKRYRLLWNEG
jgi:arylsulfatase